MKAVLETIGDLKTLGERHQSQLDWYRRRWNALSQLPPLFAEMFDIPRTEDQQQQQQQQQQQLQPSPTANVNRTWN